MNQRSASDEQTLGKQIYKSGNGRVILHRTLQHRTKRSAMSDE